MSARKTSAHLPPSFRRTRVSSPAGSPLEQICAVPLSERNALLDKTHERLVRLCGVRDCLPSDSGADHAYPAVSLAAMSELLLAVLPAATPLLQ